MSLEADRPATGRHIPALDGIRALAILLVIPHNVDVMSTSFPAIDYPAAALMHAGWIGVQLFFVLSGFLITGNLLDARGSPHYFSAFFGRRALRILPLYFAVLCAAFVIAPLLLSLPEPLRASSPHQVWLWTFLCNWTEPYGGGVYGFSHFWSLAVEEQFYLLWPLLVLRCRPPVLLWVCLGIAVLSFVIRAVLMAANFPHEALYMFTICRMDALALGAAAAAAVRIPAARARLAAMTSRIALVASILFLGTALGTRGFAVYEISTQSIGYTLLSLAFALTLLLTALPSTGLLNRAMRVLGSGVLRPIGRYSYGMYVFHLPLHVFVGSPLLHRFAAAVTPGVALTYTAGMTVATFLVAAVSYELFEQRFLRLKYRFTPAPAPGPIRT
jgi:peptidoglycan/LPS O-acetylase OafA/YrhL